MQLHRRLYVLGLTFCLLACCGSAAYAQKIGLVLLHGKEAPGNSMVQHAARLASAGHLVETPEMCWSKRRIYDRTYHGCMGDIDAAVARLRKRGATDIVVYGHSVGGNMAIGYGARRQGLKGIVVTAGGHHPGGIMGSFPPVKASFDEARQMIARGDGRKRARFADNNDTGVFHVNTTPEVFVSWYEPAGDANMTLNARKLTAPLLWISGNSDPVQRLAGPIVGAAPPHPFNRHVTVNAGHRGTPAAAHAAIVKWLQELAAQK